MPVPKHLRQPLSLRVVATKIWDLNAVPRTRAFEVLSLNCLNELERDKLNEFRTAEAQDEVYAYVNRPRRTIVEVLGDFPNATSCLTIAALFELFTTIKPRSFSIASCQEMGTIELLMAVVTYKTLLVTPRIGLCSNWLSKLKRGDTLRGTIKKGTFKIPSNKSIPLVMVGPGTGLAPFRSILMEREMSGEKSGPLILFFGCRGEKSDFHCESDLKRMESSGLVQLFTAFSRDQTRKIYVQHKIKEQSNLLKEVLQKQGGVFMVAGNSKNMPQAVKAALGEALGDDLYVEEMIKCGRYQEETWA